MSFSMPRLNSEQKQAFIRDGFLKVDQVVPQVFINRALRAINHSLGQGRDKSEIESLNQKSWCPELGQTEIIHDMFNRTPAFNLAEDLLGAGNVNQCFHGQVPPRFPQDIEIDANSVKMPHGHIDGIGSGLNGIEKGDYKRGFTCLCVVLLSNLPEDFMGNFSVWPQSHFKVQKFLADNGKEVLRKGVPKIPDIGPMEMCKGQAGDIVFAHPLLYHSACPNLSPFIRYAAIFRVCHKNVSDNGFGIFDDMWMEFEGLHDVINNPPDMAKHQTNSDY